jgi:hypothetical protein
MRYFSLLITQATRIKSIYVHTQQPVKIMSDDIDQMLLQVFPLKASAHSVVFLRGSVRQFPAFLLQVAAMRVLGNLVLR